MTSGERLRNILVIAVVVAFVATALGLVQWFRLSGDEDIARAEQRDLALAAGQEHIATLNTLDTADLDAGLQAWLDATTGAMHQDIAAISDVDREAVQDLQTTSTSQVVAIALVDFDAIADTATVIAAVETTVHGGADEDQGLKRNRYEADLVLTDDGWLVEALDLVDVDLGEPASPPLDDLDDLNDLNGLDDLDGLDGLEDLEDLEDLEEDGQ